MQKIAITGHTQGLGKYLFEILKQRGHHVQGFSRRNGYDIRDYSVVTKILEETKGYDWFINNAKPDFVQTQIVYRFYRSQTVKNVLSIGSAAVNNDPKWTDSFLLEYLTQKVALKHAHDVLPDSDQTRLILINPEHISDDFEKHAATLLDNFKL